MMKKAGQNGFTLLELLVTLFVVGLMLLLAVQLLGEVQVTFARWQRTLPDPVPQLAVQLLRSDIQRSRNIALDGDPLVLEIPDGSIVSYRKILDRLVRTVRAPDGAVREREVLSGVSSWSSTEIAGGLVEIEIVYRRHLDPGGRRRGGLGGVRDFGLAPQYLRGRYTQRSRPGRVGW